jgi:hypothetical protein
MAVNDLNIDQTTDKDYILLTIKDLSPGQTYPIQFRWKYNDGTFGQWSPARTITPPSESPPGTPNVTVSGATPGMITVSWDGKDTAGNTLNVKSVDVYFSGSPFNSSVPGVVLTKASTVQQTAPAGQYGVTAYAITARGAASVPKIISGGVEVTAVGPVIQAPTLPTGLTASSAPFALTVNWDGSYSSSATFSGFKSIDIYATSNDSLGSSTTTGLSASNIVGSLTVDRKQNRINIGLDNLRQAMSLASNATAYTTDTYLYYVAVNQNNEQYKVGGAVTYTRINSTALRPTQANFIDLASGVISIENLVAGNGSFASWLRTGSAGGARIELSAVNDFSNGGNTVQKGLVAYSSGSTEIFNLDIAAGTLSINGSGKFTGDLEIGSGDSIFKSDSNGIYLGSGSWAGAVNTFRVSRSGYLTAASGQIGGISIGANSIGAANFNLSTSGLRLGYDGTLDYNLLISSSGIIHRRGSTSTQKFTVDATTGYVSIYAGNITSSVVSGSTVFDGTGVIFDNNGLRAYVKSGTTTTKTIDINSGGSAEFKGTIYATSGEFTGAVKAASIDSDSTINGAEIIGSVIKTSTADLRIAVNETANKITFETASTIDPGEIYGESGLNGSIGYGILTINSPRNASPLGERSSIKLYSLDRTTSTILFTTDLGIFSNGITLGAGMYAPSGTTTVNKLVVGSTIDANVLGVTSSNGQGAIYQDSSGFLKVRTGTSSSIKVKDNVAPFEDISNYSNIINNMNLVTFNYKPEIVEDPWFKQIGMIVEDLVQHTDSEFLIEYKNDEPSGIFYEKIPLFLVGAFKEMTQKIEEMQARLDALEG